MFDVACIGILVADLIAKPVDTIPGAGLLERIDSIGLYSGGCAMSAGIDMSKLGLKTAVLGKIGNDSFGEFLRSELLKYHVNCDGLAVDPSVQTSASVVLSASEGERSFLHCIGANGTYGYHDVDFGIIQNSRIVFVAGTMLMDAFDGETSATVLRMAKEMNKITVLDTAWDSKGRWMNVLRPCMPHIDYFLPSMDEAVMLSGKKDPAEICDVFLAMGAKNVVIKNGKDGCFVHREGMLIGIPPYTCNAIDTTGAGDSFCAGWITGLIKGLDIVECGKFANAVGAHCVMEMGATTGIKSYEEIHEFMNQA
ncbi:MAG: carbohydrate kinase family protein [Clostridia bacterium]|nr:carbohydrate kinase family protein [Clostridia bacterium]